MIKLYKPEDLTGLIPYLVVQDTQKSAAFYNKAFGLEIVTSVPDDDGKLQHVEMRRGDIVVMFCPEGSMGITAKSPSTNNIEESISLYCYCVDVDGLYKNAIAHGANGAKSSMNPEDRLWGDRMCVLIDIGNYQWSVATHLGQSNTNNIQS